MCGIHIFKHAQVPSHLVNKGAIISYIYKSGWKFQSVVSVYHILPWYGNEDNNNWNDIPKNIIFLRFRIKCISNKISVQC